MSCENVFPYLSQKIRNVLKKVDTSVFEGMEEIRLRAGKPLMTHNWNGDWFLSVEGTLCKTADRPLIVQREDIMNTVTLMSENSVYAFQDEISNGFITLKGGHRVGLTGKVILEGGRVKNIRDFSGVNIRVAREVPGCSEKILEYILNEDRIFNTLLVSPPQCGKTTMLRDLSRNLSDGIPAFGFKGLKVGIVDERSEIAACHKGIPQYSTGVRTDVLDGCPKALGMLMMVRSMSPHVVLTDEIGNRGDKDAVMSVINAGVKIITTAHGYNITELKSRQEVLEILEQKIFERFVVLSSANGPGTVEEIIDGRTMEVIYRR